MEQAHGIKSYRDLRVWQEAMDLLVEVYRLAERFPPEERFGLRAQARDAVVSIPSNIAEGHGRASRKEYRHHISIAEGSLAEVETHVEVGVRLRYCTPEQAAPVLQRCASLGKQLKSLRNALSRPAPQRAAVTRPSPTPDPQPTTPGPRSLIPGH